MIDFIASESHFFDHLIPTYNALPKKDQGAFYITNNMIDYVHSRGLADPTIFEYDEKRHVLIPDDERPIVMSAYGILDRIVATERDFRYIPRFKIFTEHGAGFSFSGDNPQYAMNPSYAGGTGERQYVNLFLDVNDYVSRRNLYRYPTIPSVIIGCPKLDRWANQKFTMSAEPVIAVSFRWDCQVAPETTSAWRFYKDVLPSIAKRWKVIGHGHPRILPMIAPEYEKMGIEVVWDFDEVIKRADLYVNDASSTMYEFAYTGKPVVVMNSPKYRRKVNHGLRFWEYADVGVNIFEAKALEEAIENALKDEPGQQEKRQIAVNAVYPNRGNSTNIAVEAILKYTKNDVHPVKRILDKDIGIIYMAFGDNAAKEVRKSVLSMRRLGINVPVTVVGTTKVPGTNFVEWQGESPFLRTARNNFKFRAGRIKPYLLNASPYEWTMYLDADTQFVSPNFTDGFSFLADHDVVITQEKLLVSQLYNKALAGWEINLIERDQTILEIGGGNIPFWNTGVMFFSQTKATEELFNEWYVQWLRFQQWDEQLAFMRAANLIPKLRIKKLGVEWNAPHREIAKYIYHWYGTGSARSNNI